MKVSAGTAITVLVAGGLFIAATLSSFSIRDENEAVDQRAASEPADSTNGQPESGPRQLFRPEDLVLLEMPDRAVWQQPDLIMDALNIADGSKVADVGAGAGWFTIRLGDRVGPNGIVYAQDLQHQMVTAILRRVQRENLQRRPEKKLNVQVVQGQEDSPNLPAKALDAVLVVDVYPELDAGDRVRFLQSLAEALRPRGRIGIVNYRPGGGGPGPLPERRVASSRVEQDAREAGLQVLSNVALKYQYLVVLGVGGR